MIPAFYIYFDRVKYKLDDESIFRYSSFVFRGIHVPRVIIVSSCNL